MDISIDKLRDFPVFGGLTDEILKFIMHAAAYISAAAGDYFFRENDSANAMYVLLSGEVGAFKTWQEQEYLVRKLSTGDCFGEMALIDLRPRSASIKALAPCVTLELTSATFYEIYRQDLEQFTLMYMNLGRELSRRLRSSDEAAFSAMMRVRDFEMKRPEQCTNESFGAINK